MTLTEYLRTRDLTITAFAAMIGEKRETVSYIANGTRKPSGRVLAKIMAATDGRVTPAELGHSYEMPNTELHP
jgi:hypothetical protein